MYHPGATLILIGGRGTGKSTLAVITAIALCRRFVDTVSVIEAAVGSPIQDFVNTYGIEAFCALEFALLETIFAQYPTECVVATSSLVIYGPVRALLQSNTTNFPIVHISRAPTEIAKIFGSHPNRDAIMHRAVNDMPLYRQCSSFDFTNLGALYVCNHRDWGLGINVNCSETSPANNTLKERTSLGLRGLEKNFLHFVKYIYGDAIPLERDSEFLGPTLGAVGTSTLGPIIPSNSRRPWQCTEDKINPFTHALFLPFYDLTSAGIDFDRHAAGVDALILRVDLLASYAIRCGHDPLFYISTQVTFIRSLTSLPIVYDFDRSFFNLSLTLNSPVYSAVTFYTDILNLGLRLGAEYVLVSHGLLPETSLRELIHRKNFSKLISTHTLSSWDTDSVRDIYRDAVSKGFDIVQITAHAFSLKANSRLQTVLNHFSPVGLNPNIKDQHNNNSMIPLIAYNKGSLGKWSQCLNKLLTPVDCDDFFLNPHSFYYSPDDINDVTRRNSNSLPNSSPKNTTMDDIWISNFQGKRPGDCLTLKDRNNAIYSLGLQSHLQFYHFGAGVASRLSHFVNQAGFEAIYLPHKYNKVVTSKFSEIRPLLERRDFGGAAVSSPFKVTISQVCDSLSPQSRVVGAVNSLRTLRDAYTLMPRAVYGGNVDWIGIRATIAKHLRLHNAITPNTKVLIVGAGGFAHAAIYAMARLGARQFYVWSKDRKHTEFMVDHFKLLFSATSNNKHSHSHTHSSNLNSSDWNIFDGIGDFNNILPAWGKGTFDLDWTWDLGTGKDSANSEKPNNSISKHQAKKKKLNDVSSILNSDSLPDTDNTSATNLNGNDSPKKPSSARSETSTSKGQSPQRAKKLMLKNILNSEDEDEDMDPIPSDKSSVSISSETGTTRNPTNPSESVSNPPSESQSRLHSQSQSPSQSLPQTQKQSNSQPQSPSKPLSHPLQNQNEKSINTSVSQETSKPADLNYENMSQTLRTLFSNPSSPASREIWLTVLQGSFPEARTPATSETDTLSADTNSSSSSSTPSSHKPSVSSTNYRITKNYGSLSFQQSPKDSRQISFTILDSVTNPWPDMDSEDDLNKKEDQTQQKSKEPSSDKYPNIILHLTSNSELKIHPTFFASPRGGICLENNYLPCPNTSFIKQAITVGNTGWNSEDSISKSSDPSYIPPASFDFVTNATAKAAKNSRESSISEPTANPENNKEKSSTDDKKNQNDAKLRVAPWQIIGGADFMVEQTFAHFEFLTEKRAPRSVMVEKFKECLQKYTVENIDDAGKSNINNNVEDDIIEGNLKGDGGIKRIYEETT